MAFEFIYMPVFRARQQELLVLESFDFGPKIFPLIEIIKEKDRINNQESPSKIWSEHINRINATLVLVDLPTYIRDSSSMQDEVLRFNRTMLSNLDRRVEFFNSLAPLTKNIIPVVSTLLLKTGEAESITNQIHALRQNFPSIAVRTFVNTFDSDLEQIQKELTRNDILIYDMDTVQPFSPLVRKQTTLIKTILAPYKIAVRSAINSEIQNTKLDHEEIVPDADNSLIEVFRNLLGMNGFGDFVGIKKDELSSGGTISPGFIFYDPVENLYYGYKGRVKNLSEFEDQIVPAVLNSGIVKRMKVEYPEYLGDSNMGYQMLTKILSGEEKGKSQAKFKRISMEHYLFTIKKKIEKGEFD